MKPEIIIAAITSISTLIAAIVSIIVNNRVIGYKVDELAKRVELHNHLIERVAIVERDTKTAFNRIDEIREDLRRINTHS